MLADEISEKYQVTVMPVNCEQLKREDINHIMENILYEFPLTMIEFYMPKWVEMLPYDHKMKQDIIVQIKNLMCSLSNIRDITSGSFMPESEYIKKCKLDGINMSDGSVKVLLDVDDPLTVESKDQTGEKEADRIDKEEYFGYLLDTYERLVYSICFKLTGNQFDAEEIGRASCRERV